ncbi:MAG: molybdate ABC transporter substrate-binding protein [Mycobacterium sp.]
MTGRVRRVLALSAIAMLPLTACAARQEPTTPITVYAASSLIKAFTAIGKDFQEANPGYSVEFVFASSADLSSALVGGSHADVFASGDRAHMAAVTDAGDASGTPEPFAANRLVVVAQAGNPKHLVSFADLAQPDVKVAVCAEQGACGMATRGVQTQSGVHLRPATTQATPTRVLSEVTSGRADAGVVFMTDALVAGNDVSWFVVPGDAGSVSSWITVLSGTAQSREAAAFVQQVTDAGGRKILADDGFSEPLRGSAG